MITKKFYQKYLPVLFYYPPELVLRQYKTMSIFLIFGVFQMLFIYKVLNVIKAGFHRSRLNYICPADLPFSAHMFGPNISSRVYIYCRHDAQ